MTIYAEDVNYFETGRSDPDRWIEMTKKHIRELGFEFLQEAYGSDAEGRGAYMVRFRAKGDEFKVVWPVLPTRRPNKEKSAKLQAATSLYHYVKGVSLYAAVAGPKDAFFSHLVLPDGRTVSEVQELSSWLAIASNDALALPPARER